MEASVRGVFSTHFKSWSRGRRLPLHHHKAARALSGCRTAAMGTHVQYCKQGHYSRVEANACRSRSCPRCSSLSRERWVASQQSKLLACDHYHVVFTLPHELNPLFSRHRRLLVELLFRSVRETLMTLLQDERYLGAEPGIVMALHTWGRNLSRHPHIHCLVTGGGLTRTGDWRSTTGGWLLPVRVLKALYRGKFLGLLQEALRSGALSCAPDCSDASLHQTLSALRGKDWHVRLKERYPHGEGVMKYLARYVKGGPLSDSRVVQVTEASVTFRYRDHRDGRRKRMTLPAGAFMGRLLWHLPEPYQHLVRTVGVYANRAVDKRNACRSSLQQGREAVRTVNSWQSYLVQRGYGARTVCPRCGERLAATSIRRHNQNSYKKRNAVPVYVQQDDQAEIACVPQPP